MFILFNKFEKTLIKILYIIHAQDRFEGTDVDSAERAELEKKLTQKYSLETSAFYISSRVLDDGIILPQHTRQVKFFQIMCNILEKRLFIMSIKILTFQLKR